MTQSSTSEAYGPTYSDRTPLPTDPGTVIEVASEPGSTEEGERFVLDGRVWFSLADDFCWKDSNVQRAYGWRIVSEPPHVTAGKIAEVLVERGETGLADLIRSLYPGPDQ